MRMWLSKTHPSLELSGLWTQPYLKLAGLMEWSTSASAAKVLSCRAEGVEWWVREPQKQSKNNIFSAGCCVAQTRSVSQQLLRWLKKKGHERASPMLGKWGDDSFPLSWAWEPTTLGQWQNCWSTMYGQRCNQLQSPDCVSRLFLSLAKGPQVTTCGVHQGAGVVVLKKYWGNIGKPKMFWTKGLQYNYITYSFKLWGPLKVKKLRSMLGVVPDAVRLHQDSWGLKKLFSYMIRKAGKDKDTVADPKRRDPCQTSFMDDSLDKMVTNYNIQLPTTIYNSQIKIVYAMAIIDIILYMLGKWWAVSYHCFPAGFLIRSMLCTWPMRTCSSTGASGCARPNPMLSSLTMTPRRWRRSSRTFKGHWMGMNAMNRIRMRWWWLMTLTWTLCFHLTLAQWLRRMWNPMGSVSQRFLTCRNLRQFQLMMMFFAVAPRRMCS